MADLNPDLLEQAKELNIEVTENATNEALQKAIDEVLAEDGAAGAGDITELRARYKAATGKTAFNGWDAAEIQKRINASGTKDAPAKPKKQARDPLDHDKDGKKGGAAPALIPVHVNRDYWDANGVRTRKGSIVEVTVEEALDGVESGALSRVK